METSATDHSTLELRSNVGTELEVETTSGDPIQSIEARTLHQFPVTFLTYFMKLFRLLERHNRHQSHGISDRCDKHSREAHGILFVSSGDLISRLKRNHKREIEEEEIRSK